MTCNYCGSRLGEDEHRCRKCGRRPSDALRAEPAVYGSLAAQRRTALQVEPAEPALKPLRPVDLRRATQAQFPFQDRPPVRDRSDLRIVRSDPVVAARPGTRRAPDAETAAKAVRKGQSRRTPRPPGAWGGQGTLELLPSAPAKPRTLGTTVDAVIFCEAPVAARLHRAVAAAMDWIMVLIAYGLFLGVFHLLGGQFSLSRTALVCFAGDLAAIALAYGLIFALADAVTPGMRWTRLRLITFDGFPPDRKQRLARFAGSCLSMCTVIGLLWSLGDEETLTWPDHISRTFPTPKEFEQDVLHRK